MEKEVEECDAPKVAEKEVEECDTATTTNGSSEAVTENGTETETPKVAETEEAASEEAAEAPAAETNGDSTGKNNRMKPSVAVRL